MKENSAPQLRIVSELSAKQFEELLVLHLNSLYFLALRLMRSEQEAEEMVQETCLKAWRGYRGLRDPGKFRSWLAKILIHAIRNHLRKKRKEQRVVDVELSDELIRSATLAAYNQETLMNSLTDSEVEAALSKLSMEFRAVLLMSDVEGYSYKEISSALSCSMGTVASRLFRARQLMRESLEEYARRKGIL